MVCLFRHIIVADGEDSYGCPAKRGIAAPKAQLDIIERRLKRAQEDYEQWSRSEPPAPR